MEVKLETREYIGCGCSYSEKIRKTEQRDTVVTDTMPDIASVLCAWGRVLIRSKELTEGHISVEANLPVCVLCCGEDGSLFRVEQNIPFSFGGECESIAEGAAATAKIELCALEAKALNPRKIGVKAELCADMAVYERHSFFCAENPQEGEPVYAKCGRENLSLIQVVGEKSFLISDEISLPPGADGSGEPMCIGVDAIVDDVKSVGTKLIVKGRVKSRLLLQKGKGLSHLEPVSEFSQIVELGEELGEGISDVWLTPSGTYCSLLREGEGRISLEYHIVAQIIARSDREVKFMDEAYSNRFRLEEQRSLMSGEYLRSMGNYRESCRQLFETCREVSEVLYSGCAFGKPEFEEGKMLLPFTLTALCSGGDGVWCEKRRGEITFRIPSCDGQPLLVHAEERGLALLPVAGGVELRMDVEARLSCREQKSFFHISALSYDEEKPKDTEKLPSIVLLRLTGEERLWDIAKENCSEAGAILKVNGIEELSQRKGELLLVPKVC